MIPKTPEELTALIKEAMTFKLYTAITLAARQKRLTEHDIGIIEQSVLREFNVAESFAHEFTTFEAEPAVSHAIDIVRQFTQHAKRTRASQIAKGG